MHSDYTQQNTKKRNFGILIKFRESRDSADSTSIGEVNVEKFDKTRIANDCANRESNRKRYKGRRESSTVLNFRSKIGYLIRLPLARHCMKIANEAYDGTTFFLHVNH